MNIITNEIDAKLWCCTEALDATIAKGEGMSVESLRTLRKGFGEAVEEIERLREIAHRLDGLAMQAAGHIPSKGIGDDFRKNIKLCQAVDLEPERIRAAKEHRERTIG